MGRNCARASPPAGSGRFQEQEHSFSPSEPTLLVNNRFIFSLKTIKLQAMRLCHFNFLLKTFLNYFLFVHAIQFCTREIRNKVAMNGKKQTIYGKR